ncbi:MAG TPA: response regulator [Candidatus Gastranaerophilales bacterium]|nr:response regulator [Candidatus Gastranaerophilales bacterium]
MLKVLVIDDSPFIFKAVKKALENSVFDVVDNAGNGKIGLEMYEKYAPDLITLDVTMPIMDGVETAKALVAKNPNVKIIMLSAMGDEALLSQAKEIGVSGFLRKPFKPEELLNKAKEILGV